MLFTRRSFTATTSALALVAACTPTASAEPIVETRSGRVRGALADGVYTFKGIPYGASTAGANRFKPPQPVTPWTDVRDALNWGANAPQSTSSGAVPQQRGAWFAQYFGDPSNTPTETSEDCLVLNVWTPGLDTEKRPVMVWIHGGGFEVGTGSAAPTTGAHLTARQNVVTVSLNHRLGVLGYTDLSAYGEEYALSGVAGQLDQIAALEWVRDNIEKFGGDPNNVTIHGQSGGGAKVTILMAMPAAQGLFHKAIAESGSANRPATQEQSRATAAALLDSLHLDGTKIADLQNMPAQQLVDSSIALAAASMAGPPAQRRSFSPTTGSTAFPRAPIDAVGDGSMGHIPLIIGCTKEEATLFLAGSGLDLASVTDAQLAERARALGPNGAQVIAAYRRQYPDYSPGDLLIRALSDGSRMNAIRFAEAHARGGAPTYMYLFSWRSKVLPNMQSGHGIDTTFFFDTTDMVEIASNDPEATALATKQSTSIATFAKTGAPAAPGLPEWPQYDTQTRATMVFDVNCEVVNDPMKQDREMRERLTPAT